MKKNILLPLSLLITILALTAAPLPAQEQRPEAVAKSNPGQVFQEILKSYESLKDYTTKIQAKVKMPGFRVPDFTAKLYFKRPDKFHIETKSFAPLPRNSGVFNPFLFDPEKNRITYRQAEALNGVRAELYKVEPLEDEARIRYYQVWIGGSPKRILQVESHSFKGTKALVQPEYQTVQAGSEKWLLPEKVHVHMTFPGGGQGPDASLFAAQDNPFSRGMGRIDNIPGEGDIYLTYSEWQINTGLDDGLFQKNRER
ncbi:MAG: hypothetical protein JW950_10570 [Deltaproteobacteria bacterium]|nr:hypothetical protein [Deltaproteobacteria bacterium]